MCSSDLQDNQNDQNDEAVSFNEKKLLERKGEDVHVEKAPDNEIEVGKTRPGAVCRFRAPLIAYAGDHVVPNSSR